MGNQARTRTSSHDGLEVRKLYSHGGIGHGGVAKAPPGLQFECIPSAMSNPGGNARLGELVNKLKPKCLPPSTIFLDSGLGLLQQAPWQSGGSWRQ